MPYWGRYAGTGVSSQSNQFGQVKPTGVPRGVNSSSPLMTTIPLFYGFDTGFGTIVDVTGNVALTSQNVPSNVTSSFGTSISWDAANGDTSTGYYGDPTTAIHLATDLSALGVGAGWTLAIAFRPTGNAFQSLIAGRPAHANEAQPFANWSILFENGTVGDRTITALLNNNNAAATCGTFTYGAYGIFGTAVLSVQNTSSGVAAANFYANGSLVATTTGLVVQDTGPSYSGPRQDVEEQIQFGTIYHVQTTHNFNDFTGQSFEQIFVPSAWSGSQAALFHSQPYDGVLF